MSGCLSGTVGTTLSCNLAPLDLEELFDAVTAGVDVSYVDVFAHLEQMVSHGRQLL